MPDGIAPVVQFKDRTGPGDRLLRLPNRKLHGVPGGVDHHQSPGSNQAQHLPLVGKGQHAGNQFAHAAGSPEIGLVVADRTDRHHALQSLVQCPGINRLVATSGGPRHAQAFRIDLGSCLQIIHRAHVLLDLDPAQQRARRPQRRGHHLAVVFAEPGLQSAFTGTEGIDGKHKETELGQADAAGLNDRVLLRAAPVTMHAQDRRHSLCVSGRHLGHIGIGRHLDPTVAGANRPQHQVLDPVTIPFLLTDLADRHRPRFVGRQANRLDQVLTDGCPQILPVIQCLRDRLTVSQLASRPTNELEKFSRSRCTSLCHDNSIPSEKNRTEIGRSPLRLLIV